MSYKDVLCTFLSNVTANVHSDCSIVFYGLYGPVLLRIMGKVIIVVFRLMVYLHFCFVFSELIPPNCGVLFPWT